MPSACGLPKEEQSRTSRPPERAGVPLIDVNPVRVSPSERTPHPLRDLGLNSFEEVTLNIEQPRRKEPLGGYLKLAGVFVGVTSLTLRWLRRSREAFQNRARGTHRSRRTEGEGGGFRTSASRRGACYVSALRGHWSAGALSLTYFASPPPDDSRESFFRVPWSHT